MQGTMSGVHTTLSGVQRDISVVRTLRAPANVGTALLSMNPAGEMSMGAAVARQEVDVIYPEAVSFAPPARCAVS
jgi:hypothetical protein